VENKKFYQNTKNPQSINDWGFKINRIGIRILRLGRSNPFNVFGLAFKATPSGVPFTRRPIWGG
jgi:hypothetical protein